MYIHSSALIGPSSQATLPVLVVSTPALSDRLLVVAERPGTFCWNRKTFQGEVDFVGCLIGAVAADTVTAARTAAGLVEVIYNTTSPSQVSNRPDPHHPQLILA